MTSASHALAASWTPSDTMAERLNRAFDRHGDALYRYFLVRTGSDGHLADDLTQQLWVQAACSDREIPEPEIEFWLRGIARNLLVTHWRRRATRPTAVPIANPVLAAQLAARLATEDLPGDELARREVRDQVLLALTELSSEEQTLILGHYFEGRSFAELAAEIAISPRAVEGRLYRARASLRKKLQRLA